jgi:hypothetical protein
MNKFLLQAFSYLLLMWFEFYERDKTRKKPMNQHDQGTSNAKNIRLIEISLDVLFASINFGHF